MVRNVKRLALAGAFLMVAAPAFAQVPPQINPLGVDLDPFHLFSSPAPAPAPMAEPMMRKHHMMRHRMMHHSMMHKPMMKKHMMMKKPMMKKPMMKSDAK